MTEDSLLEAIRAEPDDPTARLVLADWLESQRQADRAAFVRLQVQRAALPAWDVRAVLLRLDERRLLAEHRDAWRAELPALDGVRWGRFESGLVGRVAFDSPEALATHHAACAAATVVTAVTLAWPRRGARPTLEPWPGLQELTLVGTLVQPEDLAWLATSPLLSTVVRLNLVESQLSAEALLQLWSSPYLAQLEALRLPAHDAGNGLIDQLVAAELPNLVELDVSVASEDDLGSGGRYRPTMDAAGARRLAGWSGLAGLQTLKVTGNQIGREGLSALVSSPSLGQLRHLDLRGIDDWGEDGKDDVLVSLADAHPDLRLTSLDLGENQVTDASEAALRDCSALQGLQVLHYDYSHSSIPRVMGLPWVESLRVLSANDCGEDGMRAVLGRTLPHLHTASLSSHYGWSRVEDLGEVLGGAVVQPSLVQLSLVDSGFDDASLAALGASPSFPALRSLDLTNEWDEFSEAATRSFLQTPLGQQLVSVATGWPEVDRAPEPPVLAVGSGEYRGPLREL